LNKVGAFFAQLWRNSATVCSGVACSKALIIHLSATFSSWATDSATIALFTASTEADNKTTAFITQYFLDDFIQ
jgi:hypothetical protein